MVRREVLDAVYRTVGWFSLLGQPVLAEEVHRSLMGVKASLVEVKYALYTHPGLGRSVGLYFLKGQEKTVFARYQRTETVKKLWERVAAYAWALRLVPCVRMIAVGNTLAFGTAERGSDIDLFVVTERRRLFIARTFLLGITSLLRIRRHGQKVSGRFCLSFLVDEAASDVSNVRIGAEDPYLAFWTAHLKLVTGDAKQFVKENAWVRKVFPNLPQGFIEGVARKSSALARLCSWLLSGWLGDRVENWLKVWQMRRAERKKTNTTKNAVVITSRVLKFHETDKRELFLEEFKKLTEGEGVKKKKKATRVKQKAVGNKK